MTNSEKISSLIRHIKLVEDNCNIISKKVMDTNPEFAIEISKRGRLHDISKFDDLEFKNLWRGEKNFDIALLHHHCHNSHHPEHYKSGIYGMSEIDIAEMVCDCTARGQEFGTDVRIWFFDPEKAPKKYGYVDDNVIISKIEYYVSLLLNKPFIFTT